MCYKKPFWLVLVTLLMLAPAATLLAQDDEGFTPAEEALIKQIEDAQRALIDAPAYEFAVTQRIHQTITNLDQPDAPLTVSIEQDTTGLQVNLGGDTFNSMQTFDQSTTVIIPEIPPQVTTLVMELRLVDSVNYIRVVETNDTFTAYPEGWLNWTENPNAFPGAETFNVEELFNLSNTIVPLTAVAPDTLLSVEELEPTDINGVGVRPIQLTWDALAFYSSEDVNLGGLLNLEDSGDNADEFLATFFDGASLIYVAYLDAEDGTLRFADVLLETDSIFPPELSGSSSLTLQQEVFTTSTFTLLDEQPEIVAPEVEE
jgi:hypothetical protein